MTTLRSLSFTVIFVLAVSAGCDDNHHYDDDVNLGRLRRGESRDVEVHAFAASPVRLEECDTAEVVGIRGPDGKLQPVGKNVDAEAHGVVSKNAFGECESDVLVSVRPEAALGLYSIEVEFEYFVFGDRFVRDTSAFIDLRVDEAAPTPTPSPTATVSPVPTLASE